MHPLWYDKSDSVSHALQTIVHIFLSQCAALVACHNTHIVESVAKYCQFGCFRCFCIAPCVQFHHNTGVSHSKGQHNADKGRIVSRQTLVRTGVFDHRCLGDDCPPLSAAALRRVPFRRLPAASAKTVLMMFSVYTIPNHTTQSLVLYVIFRRLCVVHMRMCVCV